MYQKSNFSDSLFNPGGAKVKQKTAKARIRDIFQKKMPGGNPEVALNIYRAHAPRTGNISRVEANNLITMAINRALQPLSFPSQPVGTRTSGAPGSNAPDGPSPTGGVPSAGPMTPNQYIGQIMSRVAQQGVARTEEEKAVLHGMGADSMNFSTAAKQLYPVFNQATESGMKLTMGGKEKFGRFNSPKQNQGSSYLTAGAGLRQNVMPMDGGHLSKFEKLINPLSVPGGISGQRVEADNDKLLENFRQTAPMKTTGPPMVNTDVEAATIDAKNEVKAQLEGQQSAAFGNVPEMLGAAHRSLVEDQGQAMPFMQMQQN